MADGKKDKGGRKDKKGKAEEQPAAAEQAATREKAEQHLDQKGAIATLKDPAANQPHLNRIFLMVLLVVAGLLFVWVVHIFVVDMIIAATFTTLFLPLHNWILKKLRGRKNLASLVTCLILILGLLIPSIIVGNIVVQQSLEIFKSSQDWLSNFMETGAGGDMYDRIKGSSWFGWLNLQNLDLGAVQSALETIGAVASKVISKTYQSVIGFLVSIFVVFFTMFYFFRDGYKLEEKLKDFSPLHKRYENAIVDRFVMISRATAKGTLLIGLIQGSVGGVTFLIFGIDGWALWAVVMVILSVIPLLGAWIVMIPAGIIQIVLGNIGKGVAIILISVIVVSSIDNLLRPRLVGKEAKMHDLVIFFSTLGGISIFGVMGFIVGPVIAAFFLTILDIYIVEFKSELRLPQDTRLPDIEK